MSKPPLRVRVERMSGRKLMPQTSFYADAIGAYEEGILVQDAAMKIYFDPVYGYENSTVQWTIPLHTLAPDELTRIQQHFEIGEFSPEAIAAMNAAIASPCD